MPWHATGKVRWPLGEGGAYDSNRKKKSYVGGAIGRLDEGARPLLAITEQGAPLVDWTEATPERGLIGFTWLKHWRAGTGLPNLDDALSYVAEYPGWDDSSWDPPDSTDLAGEQWQTSGAGDEGWGLIVIGQLDLAVIGSYPGGLLHLMGAATDVGGGDDRWMRFTADLPGSDVRLTCNFYQSEGSVSCIVPAVDPVVVSMHVEGGAAVTSVFVAISSGGGGASGPWG